MQGIKTAKRESYPTFCNDLVEFPSLSVSLSSKFSIGHPLHYNAVLRRRTSPLLQRGTDELQNIRNY